MSSLTSSHARAQAAPIARMDSLRQALRVMRTLAPADFPALPRPVRDVLEGRGCRIPQVEWVGGDATAAEIAAGHAKRDNVVRGAFTGAGRDDWAVLCTARDTTRVLVFGRDPLHPLELAAAPNTAWLGHAPGEPYSLAHALERWPGDRMHPDGEDQALTSAEQRVPRHDAVLIADVHEGVGQAWYWTGRRWVRAGGYH